VLKKLFKSAAAFFILLGCYFGYVRLFAIVVQQFTATHNTGGIMFAVHDSKSKMISIQYSKAAMGPGHWSSAPDLGYRYYNTERGYYIYAREAKRIVEEDGVRYDGKRMRLKPFLLIMKSHDGKNTKVITSDEAIIDLNAPLGFNANSDGEPLKIKHAHLEPNVRIRDDKNTPDDKTDDMIGAVTYFDYDDPTRRITTDSHVIIQDPDMVTNGDGLVIQLRKDDGPRPPGSSSGFEGAERIDINKNVHVVMRDVGKSGLMPDGAPKRTAEVTIGPAGAAPKAAKPAPPAEPTPLDVTCDGKMQVFLPRSKMPVALGPPEPPAPTLAQFERNVVVLRGQVDDRPDQLTCDTLKLTLVPGDKAPQPRAAPPTAQKANASSPAPGLAQGPAAARNLATGDARTKDKADAVVQSKTSPRTGEGGTNNGTSESNAGPGGTQSTGLFGNLVLQRAHATGHAVWLSLPSQGIKLRCNELIHLKQAPFKPDKTYFRGDLTRPLEIEKVDIVENEEDPDEDEVISVTHIRTVDATMYDRGDGMGVGAADVVANGPGRLETRPGRGQPVERIAIWQDKLYLQNELGPEGQVVRKLIVLTGKRPCFIDQAKKSSLDSAYLIKVWLKPKPKPDPAPSGAASSANAVAGGAGSSSGVAASLPASRPQTPVSNPDAKSAATTGDRPSSAPGLGGGNFDIEHLLALRDVHLLAPAKTMTARERFEAEFVQPEPTPTVLTNQAKASAASNSTATNSVSNSSPTRVVSNSTTSNPAQAKKPDAAPAQNQEPVVADGKPEEPPAEPAMVGSAERMWVRMEMKPVKAAPADSSGDKNKTASTTSTKAGSTGRAATDTNAEIRYAWLWGSVSLHQEPAEGKTKGQDASGEAIYVDNRGEGKVISYVYQRDPNEKTYLAGPLPPARVENDDKTITAAGVIKMNQATDQAWVAGPGTLTQQSERAPDPPPATGAGIQPAVATAPKTIQPAVATTPRTGGSGSPVSPRPTSMLSRNDRPVKTAEVNGKESAVKPKTRAGVPLSKIVTTTIQFSERMEFTGRTTDPQGNPAACGDFHGVVTALMEDALLHCEERMITYTDQVVPLAQLGAMSKTQSKSKSGAGEQPDSDTAADPATDQPKPQLALLECYRNAVLITREVDPDRPILLQRKKVEAEEVLYYDKRTGDFTIRDKGQVFLYDRSDNSGAEGKNPAGDKNPKGKTSSPRSKKTAEPKVEEIPSLVLTHITFVKGMRSQPGTGGEDDKFKTHWYEFFGDVQLGRAKVPDGQTVLNFDGLPGDAIFLTGQTMRFITEPPPVGSPASAPARDFGKAWENAQFTDNDKVLKTDVITFESEKDLVYAYGEGGRGVTYAQQHASGQPASEGTARALRYHPKSGSMDLLDNSSIQLVDKNTGVRPSAAEAFDPDIKKKKPAKKGFRIPANNMERRGFSGQ
jgi:hypothetical protein